MMTDDVREFVALVEGYARVGRGVADNDQSERSLLEDPTGLLSQRHANNGQAPRLNLILFFFIALNYVRRVMFSQR